MMKALEHTWFFKGYFEDRAYWDETDYEKELDEKIDSLKTLQQTAASQMEESSSLKSRFADEY